MSRAATAAAALLCGALGAGLYLSVLTGSAGAAILVSLAQLPLFVSGLWLGAGAAALAALSAAAVVLAVSGDVGAAALFAALHAVPVVVLVRQALLARADGQGGLEWYPPGQLAAWLTGLALAALGAGLLWFGGPEALRSMLARALAPAIAELVEATATERRALTDALATLVPGILAASWMMLVITNGVLAQGLLTRFGANWRPSPRIAALRLPLWVTPMLGAAAILTLLGEPARFIGINMLIVLSVAFCLEGLAVVHAFADRLRRPAMPLVIFYVLAGLFGWPLLLVALLGLIDVPLGLRQRFVPRQSLGGK